MRYTKFTRIEDPTRKQVWQAMIRTVDFWISAVIITSLTIFALLEIPGDTDVFWLGFAIAIAAAMLWTLRWDYKKMRARLMGVCPYCRKPASA